MKQTIIAVLLALATVHHAMAQDEQRGNGQRGPHGNPEERLERMRDHLGLSDEQMAQMREIRESGGSRRDMRDQMREVLTDEQLDMMREHRAQRGGKRGGEYRGERPEPDAEESS